MRRSLATAALMALALAGCGGGGGSASTSGDAVPNAAPTAANNGGTSGTISSNGGSSANLTLSFTPRSATSSSSQRSPKYVSPSTTTVTVTINTINGSATIPSYITPNPDTVVLSVGTNCTLAGPIETCSIPVPAPSGQVNYTIVLGDGTHTLSTFTGTVTFVQGQSNSLNIALEGVPSQVDIFGTGLVAGTALGSGGEGLAVPVYDADHNQVQGTAPLAHQVTLTDNDATGATGLILNNTGPPASTAVMLSSNDAVNLTYTGQAINNFKIVPSGTGVTAGPNSINVQVSDIVFSGTTDDTAATGGISTDPNWGQQTVFFTNSTTPQVISASEVGYTNTPYDLLFTPVVVQSCTNIATLSAGPATSFTVTPGTTPGICEVRLEETGTGYPLTNHATDASGSETHDGTFWIANTTAGFSVNGKVRK